MDNSKYYYDTISKRLITVDEFMSDLCNSVIFSTKRKYNVLVFKDYPSFLDYEKIEQLSMFDSSFW